MANKRIKEVSVFIQKYHGQKTDNPGAFAPSLLGVFRSIKMAKEAIVTFGYMSHEFNEILKEHARKTGVTDEFPCITRCQFGDGCTEWGYEFEMHERGIFKSTDADTYPEFKMYYTVEYYD